MSFWCGGNTGSLEKISQFPTRLCEVGRRITISQVFAVGTAYPDQPGRQKCLSLTPLDVGHLLDEVLKLLVGAHPFGCAGQSPLVLA